MNKHFVNKIEAEDTNQLSNHCWQDTGYYFIVFFLQKNREPLN